MFNNKVAIITGAGRGIGQATAIKFAEENFKLAIVSLTENVKHTYEMIKSRYPSVDIIYFEGDVSDSDFCRNVVEETFRKFKRINVLINAAGYLGPVGFSSEVDKEEWKKTILVNLFGTFSMCSDVLKRMKIQGYGKIINFAGGGAGYSYPRFSAYASSKVAIVRLTEILADEYSNIQINCIAPGAVETDMLMQVRKSGGEVKTTVSMDEPLKLVSFL